MRVDEISGTLSTAAGFAQVGVSAPMLTLGTVKIDGDPVFFNDAGGITITGPVDVQEALRIIARDDIVFDGAPVSITARDAGGVGQEISLIAGADITTGTDPTLTIPPLTSTATSDVTVAGPSANGGRITASSTTPAFSINSFAACSGCPGGSIVLAAFRGQSSGSGGSIDLPLASINSSGNGAGAAGNVTAIAGASSGTGVSLFRITASNASGGGGNVGIFSAQPTTSDGLDIVFQTDGTISSANFLVPSSGAAAEGAITLDQGISARGNILAVTNGSFALTDLNASLSTANSDSGPGGNINVLAGGDINLGNEARTRGTDADSGHVLAAAGVTSSFAAGEVSVTGFSGTGGRIASGFIDTRPGFDLGPGGAGGDITLIAFRGTSGTSGTIANAAGSTAGGFSRGGSQLVVGGAETGTALQFDTIATGMDTGGTPG